MGQIERTWSTDSVAPVERLSYWIEAICEAFLEMKVDSPAPSEFTANLTQHPFGPIDLNFAGTAVQEVWRTPQMIARSRKHTFYLLHVREGRLVVRQRGRTADIAPGDCVLVNGIVPYSFSFPEINRCLSVQIPQDWLRTWLPAPEDVIATPFAAHSRWGATLARMVGNLAEEELDKLALPSHVVADQLGALIALAVGNHPASTTTHQQALLRRIRQSLKERLQDSGLDPAAVAAEHGISKRYLHLLFAAADTSFGAELMRVRLEQAKRLLDDRRFDRLGMDEIAWRCGFADQSHFRPSLPEALRRPACRLSQGAALLDRISCADGREVRIQSASLASKN